MHMLRTSVFVKHCKFLSFSLSFFQLPAEYPQEVPPILWRCSGFGEQSVWGWHKWSRPLAAVKVRDAEEGWRDAYLLKNLGRDNRTAHRHLGNRRVTQRAALTHNNSPPLKTKPQPVTASACLWEGMLVIKLPAPSLDITRVSACACVWVKDQEPIVQECSLSSAFWERELCVSVFHMHVFLVPSHFNLLVSSKTEWVQASSYTCPVKKKVSCPCQKLRL